MIPAHNEKARLPRCLESVAVAATNLSVPVLVVVVLDSCDDGSTDLAGQFGPDVHFLPVEVRNVGAAREAGFGHARTLCGADHAATWYASTDADTEVDPDWLERQIGSGADVVLGVVRIPEWRHHPESVARRFQLDYLSDGDDHRHVHGANLGCRADAYWQVGGFRAFTTGEDVDLEDRFTYAGYRIHWDAELSVKTSDRSSGRAPGGFAEHLAGVSREVSADTQDEEAS